jgi:hypothetical protein
VQLALSGLTRPVLGERERPSLGAGDWGGRRHFWLLAPFAIRPQSQSTWLDLLVACGAQQVQVQMQAVVPAPEPRAESRGPAEGPPNAGSAVLFSYSIEIEKPSAISHRPPSRPSSTTPRTPHTTF